MTRRVKKMRPVAPLDPHALEVEVSTDSVPPRHDDEPIEPPWCEAAPESARPISYEEWENLERTISQACLRVNDGGFLRPLKESDVTQAYVDGLNDPKVNRFLVSPNVQQQTMATVQGFVRANENDENGILFGLFVDDKHVGNVRLHDINRSKSCAYIGIALFDKAVWGRGLGTKALRQVVVFAFEELDLATVRAGISNANIASQRAFQKAGFTQEKATAQENDTGSSIWVVRDEGTPETSPECDK